MLAGSRVGDRLLVGKRRSSRMIASQEWAGKLRLVFEWGLSCLLKLMIILFTRAQPTIPEAHPPPQQPRHGPSGVWASALLAL